MVWSRHVRDSAVSRVEMCFLLWEGQVTRSVWHTETLSKRVFVIRSRQAGCRESRGTSRHGFHGVRSPPTTSSFPSFLLDAPLTLSRLNQAHPFHRPWHLLTPGPLLPLPSCRQLCVTSVPFGHLQIRDLLRQGDQSRQEDRRSTAVHDIHSYVWGRRHLHVEPQDSYRVREPPPKLLRWSL